MEIFVQKIKLLLILKLVRKLLVLYKNLLVKCKDLQIFQKSWVGPNFLELPYFKFRINKKAFSFK